MHNNLELTDSKQIIIIILRNWIHICEDVIDTKEKIIAVEVELND